MLERCSIGAVLALAVLALPARAQVQLEWKFKEGDKFYLETVNSFKQSMKTLGKELKQDLDMTFVFSVAVQKVNPDKSAVLEEKVESVEVKNTGGPTGAIAAEDKFNQQVKGATFRVTVTPRGEVTKFEGYDDLVKRLAGDDAVTQKTVRAVLSEDYIKNAAADVFGRLPDRPVKANDSWGDDKKLDMPLGPLGTFTATRTYTYEGKDTVDGKSVDKIGFTGKATYSPPKSGEAGPFPFQLTKGDLQVENLSGTLAFDDSAGRLVESNTSMRVKGSMTAVVSGTTLDSELQQERAIKTRLLDKPPTRQ
jgi:Family of unknown function (DUF6263)